MPTSAVSAWFVGGGGVSLVRHSGAYSFLVPILGGVALKYAVFCSFLLFFCKFGKFIYIFFACYINILYPPLLVPTEMARGVDLKFAGGGGGGAFEG
jgi:hypothetical protein